MSLRYKLLDELRGPKSPSTPSGFHAAAIPAEPNAATPESAAEAVSHPPGACPRCGHSGPLQHVAGGVKRCAQCGLQSKVNQATGIKRSELETFSGGRMQMNPAGFYRALAKIRGCGR